MQNNQDDVLVLVDGSSYLYRAFFALPPLMGPHGEPTGAIYGVLNMLRRLLNDFQPTYVAVVFDDKGKTFRDDIFEEYKAHRPPMPDDLQKQIEPLHTLVRAMGFPMLMVPGVEADDVIGTLAQRAASHQIRTIISTGDKDMAQLVSPRITLVNTMSDSTLDRDGVIAKFGVPPERIIDYLALVGDSSDNIPGVPKVGPKTAAKWLQEYGSLDNLLEHKHEISGKVGESLRDSLEQLALSKRLATIHTEVALPTEVKDLRMQPPAVATLREWYQRLGFKTWLGQLNVANEAPTQDSAPNVPIAPQGDSASAAAPSKKAHYETITTADQLDHWLTRLKQATQFAFDLETNGLDYITADIVGFSFAVDHGEAAYLPVAHDYPGAPDQLSRDWVLQKLKPLLEDAGRTIVGQNVKFDMSILARYGVGYAGAHHDTMLESYVLDSTASRHDMDSLAEKYLSYKTITFEEVAGKGVKQLTFNEIDLERATEYAAEDADITLRLHDTFWPKLANEKRLAQLYQEIEMPLAPVLSTMERIGVLVDTKLLKQQSQELAERLVTIEHEAHRLAGQPFNLSSPKQLQEILFTKLQIPVTEKTPTGQPSTAESVLQELALDYPLPKVILEHRTLSKLKSTYTDKLPQQVSVATGRVHTSYHQAVAATGRLSSSDPNLQNIPIRNPEGRRIRQAFIAPPGFQLVAADYSQIELRIMAHLSNDEGLLSAFREGGDVHRATAAEVFGVQPEQVSDDQRRSAKAINFGLIYGMSPFGLARQLGIDRSAAQEYVTRYFARYPGVKEFMDRTRSEAGDQGYVETIYGRRLYLPEIRSRNAQRRQYAERTAINAPMQGSAADIIKRAMINVHNWIQTKTPPVRMIMQVHDELVFEISRDYVKEGIEHIRRHMTQAADLVIPLVVDVGVGENWDEAH